MGELSPKPETPKSLFQTQSNPEIPGSGNREQFLKSHLTIQEKKVGTMTEDAEKHEGSAKLSSTVSDDSRPPTILPEKGIAEASPPSSSSRNSNDHVDTNDSQQSSPAAGEEHNALQLTPSQNEKRNRKRIIAIMGALCVRSSCITLRDAPLERFDITDI